MIQTIPITHTIIPYTYKGSTFSTEQFRGAFIDFALNNLTEEEKNMYPVHWIHNKDENGKPLTRYSRIQYQTNKKEIGITAIGELDKLINIIIDKIRKNPDTFTVNKKEIHLGLPYQYTEHWLPVTAKPQVYEMEKWIPFRSENLGDESRFPQIIWGNIHRFLSDMNIKFDKKPFIHILDYKRNKKRFKAYNVKWFSYKIIFSTDINLPQNIGLGHIISLGAGKIKKKKLL